jgi:DNA-binding IclR family transcriptional regulator
MPSAITKAFTVMRLLRRNPGAMSVTELAKAARVAPSTAHAILAELQAQGAVAQDEDKRYRLGPTTYYFGAGFARNSPISRAIWSDLSALGRELSLSAVIAVPWENHHLMIGVELNGNGDVEVALGGRIPLDAGSFGKVYFAWSEATPPAKPTTFTAKSAATAKEYKESVEHTRELGYGTDIEEFANGVGGVAAAVTSERRYEGLAALIGPISHMNELGLDTIGRRLSGLAARASYALGDAQRLRLLGSE